MSILKRGVLRPSVCVILAAVLCMVAGDVTAQDRSEEGAETLRFGVIADAQYCDCEPRGSRYYRASTEKMTEAVERLNGEALNFVVHLGDLIDRDFASFDDILPIYWQLTMPAYQVLGNHDFSVAPERKDEVLAHMGLYRTYYDFTVGSWRFVVLDGNDLSLYARTEGTPEYRAADSLYRQLVREDRPNAQDWNGGIGREQLRWLDRTLAEASSRDQRVIVFTHHPVYPPGGHNLWNDRQVLDVIEAYDHVVAVMSGHNHAGNYAETEGIHFLTLNGMVETPDSNAFAVVSASSNRLQVHGFGREPDRVLEY